MSVEAATKAFAGRTWGVAYRLLSEMPAGQLSPTDLDRLGISAYLVGRDNEAVAAWEQAYNRHAGDGDRAEAARCAFWAAFCLMMRGQMGHASGWLSRCESMLGQDIDCPARGYLLIPPLLGALDSDDGAGARQLATRAGEIAARFG